MRELLLKDNRSEFLRCMTEKMLTYALGRGVEPYDRCAVKQIVDQLPAKGYRFSALVNAIVQSAPFQLRRGEATGGDNAATRLQKAGIDADKLLP